MTPARLLEAWAALQPDVMTLLSDELPAVAGGNRRKAAGQRSMRWLDACLRGAAETPALRDTSCLVRHDRPCVHCAHVGMTDAGQAVSMPECQ